MKNSFALTEVLVMVGILVIVLAVSIPAINLFSRGSNLAGAAEELINNLRLAQNKTLTSEGESSWGIYFSTTTAPHQYILFKGQSYALRDSAFDKIQKLSKDQEIYEINFSGPQEVVFQRPAGTSNAAGYVSLRLKSDISKTKTVYVDSSGIANLSLPSAASDASRQKDSRHVHLAYSRQINTAAEKITLTFDFTGSPVAQDIIISSNLKNGQIYWQSKVDVAGQIQEIKVQSHRLNNPDTLFSVHRDKRFNNKSLKLQISGDSSGDLLNYDVLGQTTLGSSIYVSQLSWQ